MELVNDNTEAIKLIRYVTKAVKESVSFGISIMTLQHSVAR
jgi:hypothetical protein